MMQHLRRFGAILAALAMLGGCGHSSGSDSLGTGDHIVLMVGGLEKQIYLPAELAQQLGYFKEQGLDVELESEPAGVEAEDELLAGAVQGVVGFYDHTVDLQSKGKFVESVVQMSQAPGEVELVSSKYTSQIASPAGFKGHVLGVTGLGSSTDFLTRYIASRAGLHAGDYSLLPVEAGNSFIAAITQDKIQAGMTTEPTVSRLVADGSAKVLIDLRSPSDTVKALGGTYPAACLFMQTSWVNAHPAETQKLVNAFVKTLRYINTHPAATIADQMPSDYYAGDKPMYVQALSSGKVMFTKDGIMPADGPKTVLSVLSTFNKNVRDASINLGLTYTTSFVEKALKGK
jgi:NitT/TauT family transport system substrate-binding protein